MNEQEILDRAMRATMRVSAPDQPYDALLRRRYRKQRNQRIVAGVVGITVFVAAVWGLGIGVGGDTAAPADQPPGTPAGKTAEDVAMDFLYEMAFFETDLAVGKLASDAAVTGLGLDGIDHFRRWLSFNEATGFKIIPTSCEETGSSSRGTSVRCTFDFHGVRSEAVGRGPYSGSYFDLLVADPIIQFGTMGILDVSAHLEMAEFGPQMWDPFGEWVSTNYPEDVAVMFSNDNLTDYRLTPRSIRLWEQRTREFVKTTPAVTGPAVTFAVGWDGHGIPPEGTDLSTPVEGQPILIQDAGYEEFLGERTDCVPDQGCSERRAWYNTHLVVYADGRVLWWNDLRSACRDGRCPGGGDYILERRLTPEGTDLVRSGVELTYIVPTLVRGELVASDLPDSAWADVMARPYAPPRYSVCFEPNDATRPDAFQALVPALDLIPAPAKGLLDGSDPDPVHPGCLIVSTEDARTFHGILSDAGLDPAADHGDITPGSVVGAWLLRGAEGVYGEQVGIYLHPLWPDGDWHHLESA